MIEYAAKTPNIPIPFHKLLKVVALVDGENPQVRALLDRIKAENFEIEISDRYDRDVSDDAEVGAYIASVDGDRRELARKLAQARARRRFPNAALGARGFEQRLPTCPCSEWRARSTATSTSASRRRRSTRSRSLRASSRTA